MNHILIPKRTNKGINQIPEIDKIINIKQSSKYKANNIIDLYSTLTPTDSTNQKNKKLLITSNIKNIIKDNTNINSNKNNRNINTNKNENNISNDIIKKSLQVKNMKYKGSSSSTNIKTNYSIFKTKKLKSATSLLNNNNVNQFGSSRKMNINMPKPSTNIKNNNIHKSKSKEKMISPFHNDRKTNVFRKSMSHNRIKFPFSNDKIIDQNKIEVLYVGSEPNLKQNSSNNNNKEFKNEIKKQIKKAFKRLLTLNTDFELGPLYKIKFKSNHLTNNSHNKSKDNINRFTVNKNNEVNNNGNIIIKEEENNNNDNKIKNNCIRNNYLSKFNNVINNISYLNLINNNNINNTVRLNSNSKSRSKNKNIQIKNKNIYKSKNNYINVNLDKEDKIKTNINKNKSPIGKNNNIALLYSNNSKNKEKGMKKKSKTNNKNININININDIKTTNININNIINNETKKKITNNNTNPITNININSINSNINNIINYITNINTTNFDSFMKTNNCNYNNNINNNIIDKVYKSNKSSKDIINNDLHLKKYLDNQFKSGNNSNYLDILDNNNLIEYTLEKNHQKQNYFSLDNNNNHMTSMFTTTNNNFCIHKNKMELIKISKEKNLINKKDKVEEQKNKKIKKVLSSSRSQKITLKVNPKIKVRRKNQAQYSNKFFNNKNNEININNKNINKFINKCITKLKLNSTSAKNLKDKKYNNINNNQKKNKQYYYQKLLNNEPISPGKLIKYFYKYLKDHEVTELKDLQRINGTIYYTGEILSRINRKESTYIIIFHTNNNLKKITINDNNDNYNELNRCPSCPELRTKNSKEIKKMNKEIQNTNPNINNKFNFNDREGDYQFQKGYHLNYRYEIIELLGKGSFGEAIKCYDHKNKETVCIKIINSRDEFQNQAMVEIKILTSISLYDVNNESGNVKFYHYFIFRGHICLVFELLGQNLYEIIQLNNFSGLSLPIIRSYTIDLLFSLMLLRRVKIIHCDLKPENILVVPHKKNKVKIIDFGSSCFQYEIMYSYIQSRFYRAPEVILDLGYNYEIDIWSLGCILCELYAGAPIFSGLDEMEQINYIMKFLGPPPDFFIEKSSKSGCFFDIHNNEIYSELINSKNYNNENKKKNIKEFFNIIIKNNNNSNNNSDLTQFDNFIDFVCKCLEWNPKDRLSPEEGLMHPFITNNYDNEQIYKHKLKIKRMNNKISKGIFTSREKDRELSISSNNNIIYGNNNPQNLKNNKNFARPSLNLSFIKNDNKLNYNIIIIKENTVKNKNDIFEFTNKNSISDYFRKKSFKTKNRSMSSYNLTHFSTNENHIYNIKNSNLNRVKHNNNNNLLNIMANTDLNLRKIIKCEKKGKYLDKKKNKNKKNFNHYLPKKKNHGRLNYKNINLFRIKKE